MTDSTTQQIDDDFAWFTLAVEAATLSVRYNSMQFDVVCNLTAMPDIVREMKLQFNAKLITARDHHFGQRLRFHRNNWVIQPHQIASAII
jgi:hypothetical protein